MGGEPNDRDSAEMAPQLRDAIDASLLELYYQPIVSLANRSVTMLEALPRWPHPRLGVLGPSNFTGLAADNDLLAPLEGWAIEAAFDQLARWGSGIAADLRISLNLSESHVFGGDLAGAVRLGAARSGASPGRIGFEISESALIEAAGRSLEKLRALAQAGASLTIDDYRGDIAIERIRELPLAALKIARRTVEEIPDDAGCVGAAAEAVLLGDELGLLTIANGVESPGQLAALRELGCGYAQGSLFSVPMPAAVLDDRMAGP